MTKYLTIAIDGPSGVGKTTIASRLAKTLGIMHLDTGAMYRALGLAALRSGLDPSLTETASTVLANHTLLVRFIDGQQRTFLDEEDVTQFLRSEEISMAASTISKHQAIRDYLTGIQRNLAESNSFVLEGRDIGTVVLPQATVKIFLTASDEARTERRYSDLTQKGFAVTKEEVAADLNKRDRQDSERAVSPLRQASDAILIDSSTYLAEDTLNCVLAILREKNIKND